MRTFLILLLGVFVASSCERKATCGNQKAVEAPVLTEFESSLLGTWIGSSVNSRGGSFQWEFRLTPERRFSLTITGQDLASPEEISGRWTSLEKGASASQNLGGWIAKKDQVTLFPDKAGTHFYQLEIDEELAKQEIGYPVYVRWREDDKIEFYFDDCDAELSSHLVTAEKVE